jgi:hypothetical protein
VPGPIQEKGLKAGDSGGGGGGGVHRCQLGVVDPPILQHRRRCQRFRPLRESEESELV